jgi:hypothetical protein
VLVLVLLVLLLHRQVGPSFLLPLSEGCTAELCQQRVLPLREVLRSHPRYVIRVFWHLLLAVGVPLVQQLLLAVVDMVGLVLCSHLRVVTRVCWHRHLWRSAGVLLLVQ